MKEINFDKNTVLERVDIIEKSLEKLKDLQPLTPGKFMIGENFAVAEHYLRYALEATFDICAHILSRIPGTHSDEYKKMAVEMGKQNIVPMEFAEGRLQEMAKYRNRLTHFYFEVTPKEMFNIIQNDLVDFELFLKHIKELLLKS